MPLITDDVLELSRVSTRMTFALEPVRSAVESLLLLQWHNEMSGMAEWVYTTAHAMSAEERETNQVVMIGLFHVAIPREHWDSFPAYVDALEKAQPEALVEKLLSAYERVAPVYAKSEPVLDRAAALLSADHYLAFLLQRFPAEKMDVAVERAAYAYVANPAALQRLVVDHLRSMWEKYLAAEWKRVQPMLQKSVQAFHQVNLKGLSFLEAARQVTGQSFLEDKWTAIFADARRLIFVPHPHVGPYLLKCLGSRGEMILFFGARLPEGANIDAPDLSRTEIVMRLSALADDTRLRILRTIAEQGELRAQEVIDQLELSQSAASRHLTQLSATGFLQERRCEGGKCYTLNPDRIRSTLQAIARFLQEHERRT